VVPEKRRDAILELARHSNELKVDEIAERFGVSRETIRRDLAQLDARGLLRRVHGGALKPQTATEAPFHERMAENARAKQRIGRAAAQLFEDNDTLMVDAGSTTEAFAAELAGAGRFTIITNSVGVAGRLHRGGSTSRVYLIGGEYRGEAGETVGSLTLEHIGRYRADHAVLTVGAIDAADGFMDYDVEEAMVARAMVRQAQRVTVIADHSKFGRVAMAKVCELAAVARLVTDMPPPPPLADAIRAAGIELIVAD
jgi:DeoR/GlpR family transcriptional regulator of sugar metabolism